MNGLKAIVVTILLLVLGFGSGFALLFRMAYVALAFVAIALLWTLVNLWRLEIVRETRQQRAQVGQPIEERFVARNGLFIPKLWVEVRDYSTVPEHRASRAFALGPNGSKSWTVRTTCRRRGKYIFGPLTIVAGDPFGMFRRHRRQREVRSLVVYPATIDLPNLNIMLGVLPGGHALRQRSYHTTPNSLGIRPYVAGDSLNRIHWPSTARLGHLTVKEFELDPFSDIWLALDTMRAVQVGSGDDSTEEWGVTIAASLAKHFLERHRSVGLLMHGVMPTVIPADRGSRQLIKVMEELAVVRAVGRSSLGEIIAAESARFGRNTTLVAITSANRDDWVHTLQYQSQRGVREVAIVLDRESFGARDSSWPIIGALDSAQVPAFVVKLGDELGKVLTVPTKGRGT